MRWTFTPRPEATAAIIDVSCEHFGAICFVVRDVNGDQWEFTANRERVDGWPKRVWCYAPSWTHLDILANLSKSEPVIVSVKPSMTTIGLMYGRLLMR